MLNDVIDLNDVNIELFQPHIDEIFIRAPFFAFALFIYKTFVALFSQHFFRTASREYSAG